MQHGELRSYCGSRLVKFVLWIFINFKDTFKTGESFLIIFFQLVFFTYSKWNSDSRTRGSNWKWHLSSNCPIKKKPEKERGYTLLRERGDPLFADSGRASSEIPELMQEFKENLVDDEVPVHGDSHASSSHEASLEPTFKRREDLGKHSVNTHFPENRKCKICKRTKITRAPCRRRNGGAVPRAENFSDLITADHKVLCWLWTSKQSSICNRGAGLGHPMDPVISVQNKNFTRNPEELAKVLGAEWEAKSH